MNQLHRHYHVGALHLYLYRDLYDNLFIVAMFTGMRQGELLGLSWDNVNFKAGQITIKQQLQCKDGVYFLETPESGKCRVLSPAPVVMEALKEEQQQQNANKQIVGAAWETNLTSCARTHLVKILFAEQS